MTVAFSFKITSVNRLILNVDEENNTYNNLITKINFYYQGIDDDNTMAIYNSCVELAKPKVDSYKSFNELTENDLTSWLEQSLSLDEITLMQTVIQRNIEDIKTKTDVLPWT